jgi:hypothetical protein
LEHGGGEFIGAFDLRHVATVVDDSKLRTRDLLMKALAETERNEFVIAAP